MSALPEVKNSIHINAPAEKVWKALANPELTKKYMYGCETVSDWKAGSSLLWRGEYEGKQVVFVKGFILSIKPCIHLKYSVTDPNKKNSRRRIIKRLSHDESHPGWRPFTVTCKY